MKSKTLSSSTERSKILSSTPERSKTRSSTPSSKRSKTLSSTPSSKRSKTRSSILSSKRSKTRSSTLSSKRSKTRSSTPSSKRSKTLSSTPSSKRSKIRSSTPSSKRSKTLSSTHRLQKVEDWKIPYIYDKVKRGVDSDITYCIPVTKSKELGIGSINIANYKAIIEKKTNNKELERYIDDVYDLVSEINDINLIMFTYPYFSNEVLLLLFNTHSELLKVILENKEYLNNNVYKAFKTFSKNTVKTTSKTSQQGGGLGDLLRKKLVRAAAVVERVAGRVNLQSVVDIIEDISENIRITKRGEQRGRIIRPDDLSSFEIIDESEINTEEISIAESVVVVPPRVTHSFSADTRRGFMISEMIGGIRIFLKIGPVNQTQDVSIETVKNPHNMPNMTKIGSYLYEARIYEILNRRTEVSAPHATLDNISDYVPKLYDYGINKIKNKGSNQKREFIIKIVNDDEVLEYDVGSLVTDGLLSTDWPSPMAIDSQGRRKFCYFVTESKKGYLPYSRAVRSGILPPHKVNQFLKNAFNVLTYFYHNYGFVHWDLHSENILCNADGDVMLYDFDWATVKWSEGGDIKYTLSTFFDPEYLLVNASRFVNDSILHNRLVPGSQIIHRDQVLVHKVGHMYDLYRLFYNDGFAVHLTYPIRQRIKTLVSLINTILKNHYSPHEQYKKIPVNDFNLIGDNRLDEIKRDFLQYYDNTLVMNPFFKMFLHSFLIFQHYMAYFIPTFLTVSYL